MAGFLSIPHDLTVRPDVPPQQQPAQAAILPIGVDGNGADVTLVVNKPIAGMADEFVAYAAMPADHKIVRLLILR